MVLLRELYRYAAKTVGIAFCCASVQAASVTITGPSALQADAIALATTTYNATITASSFLPNSYTVNLVSKKPAVVCQQAPVCDLDKDLALVVAASSWSYVNGFYDGLDDQRYADQIIAGNQYNSCVSTDTCHSGATRIFNEIERQGVSTVTVINVP